MKKLLVAVLCWPLLAMSSPLAVDLHNIAFADLVRVVFSEILKTSYIVDSALLADVQPVTFSVLSSSPEKVGSEIKKMLDARGYEVATAGGITSIKKRSEGFPDDAEIFIYRPLHRSVPYLLELSQALFKPGSFVTSRNQQSPMTIQQVQGYGGMQGQGYQGQGGMPYRSPNDMMMGGQGLNATLQVDSDSIVFRGSEKEVGRLKKVLAQIDTLPGELIVKAVVFEVQTQKKEGSAVDLALSLLSGKLGLSFDGSAKSSNGSVSVNLAAGGFDVSAVFQALSSDDRFKVLTSPRMRVKSGASARFSVGNETPVLASVSYDQQGRPIQAVEYRPSGVIFELRPFVREGGSECKVTQQLSQFVPTSNGVNASPTLIKRELSTEVSINDSEIILLGGLDETKNSTNETGLSFLPAFLRGSRAEDVKTEVVLMLQAERI